VVAAAKMREKAKMAADGNTTHASSADTKDNRKDSDRPTPTSFIPAGFNLELVYELQSMSPEELG